MKADQRQEGGSLLATSARRDELRRQSLEWPSWTVSGAAASELEALIAGFLWPLRGYEADGVAAGVEVTLHVSPAFADQAGPGSHVALRDPEGVLLAALHVESRVEQDGSWGLGGTVEGVELPAHDDFRDLRSTPALIAERARALGFSGVMAFFPDELLHAGLRAALLDAAERLDAAMVVLIGASGAEHDELADFGRVRALITSVRLLPAARTICAIVPMAPLPSIEARLLRAAVVARNCGASSLAIDTDEAGSGDLAAARERMDIAAVPIRTWAYSPGEGRFVPPGSAQGVERIPPSPAEIVASPATGAGWLLSDEEIGALQRAYVPREAQGFTVFFTGLSGSGKSTIARALRVRLMEMTGRPVTLLDGDRVRRHLSSELGFSREHRDLNILRIGWVASEITRHGGIALCAPIAPYDAIRRRVRAMIEPAGGFVMVHVSTPLAACEARDRKGLYAKARAGLLPQFTGISDPYEPPADAAVTIDTTNTSVEDACSLVVAALASHGYLGHRP